ncbi:MAG TPA: hypothetical protein VFL27_04045 [Candidatus Dormibacteraeota bacterium]|nr:hypothetical protein [Candidatus Dormibacteraeota bacterium]
MGRRLLMSVGIASLVLSAACSHDVEGLRTPRSPASQTLGIKWHEGTHVVYRWQLDQDYSVFGNQPLKRTISGNIDILVMSVSAEGIAAIQFTLSLDAQYVAAGQSRAFVYNVDVGARGRITSNPDGNFVELVHLHTAMPFLPPAGASIGDRWHETYKIPNPEYGDTRDFSVNGQYVRVEGTGLSRAVVIHAQMFATFDDAAPYEKLYGPPPADVPQHIEDHFKGTESADITYRFDPVRQTLLTSVAKNTYDAVETYTDVSNGQTLAPHDQYVGTETVTIGRS